MEILKKINYAAAFPFLLAVRLYQRTLSPDHGPIQVLYPAGFCKFYPSCSEFAAQSLKKNGILALPKIFKRLFSCSPISRGGIDLP